MERGLHKIILYLFTPQKTKISYMTPTHWLSYLCLVKSCDCQKRNKTYAFHHKDCCYFRSNIVCYGVCIFSFLRLKLTIQKGLSIN